MLKHNTVTLIAILQFERLNAWFKQKQVKQGHTMSSMNLPE